MLLKILKIWPAWPKIWHWIACCIHATLICTILSFWLCKVLNHHVSHCILHTFVNNFFTLNRTTLTEWQGKARISQLLQPALQSLTFLIYFSLLTLILLWCTVNIVHFGDGKCSPLVMCHFMILLLFDFG